MQIKTNCSVGYGVTLILPYGTTDDVSGRNEIKDDGSIEAVYHNSNDSNTTDSERNPMKADDIALHLKDAPTSRTTCTYDNCIDDYLNNGAEAKLCTHYLRSCCDPTTGVCQLLKTKVTLTSGINLTVYGTMLISGELDGGGAGNEFTGQTSGYYAQFVLEESATLDVFGTLHVPGFITNSSENNESSKVTVYSSGTIYQPFVIRDFKGGTITGSIYHSITDGVPYSPFNEFSTMNVYVDMYIYGSVIGYANIYANSAQNATVTPLIGLDNASLITLTGNGSYVVVHHNPETDVIKLDFYGGATVNTFKVTVEVPILGALTMTSQQFVFPISWMYDITLHNGEYYMQNGNRFKLLPGAKFTVESDASLDISYLHVYDSFTAESVVKHYPRAYQETPALFIVNGKVTVDKLGGKVYSTGNNATLTIKQSISITTKEPLTYASNTEVIAGVLSSSSGRVKSDDPITSTVSLHYLYSQNGELIVNDFAGNNKLSAGTPYASDSSTKNWKEKSTFILNVNGYTVSVNGGAPQSGAVEVEEGDTLVFNLASNQFISLNGSTEFSYSEYNALTWGTYTIASASKSSLATLKVLTAVKLTLNGNGGATVTISYTTDSNSDGVLDATVKAEGEMYANGNIKIIANDKTLSEGKGSDKSSANNTTITATITEESSLSVTYKKGSWECVTPDTLVTLADGSQKRIDEVNYDDMILVWNFYEGRYEVVPSALIQNHGYGWNDIIKLTFSDGTVTKAVNEHGYFDATLNEFVMITPHNAFEYVGHEFVKADGDSYTTVKLVNVEIYEEYVEAYSILTAYYYNFITDNMFSLTSPVIETNFFMPFEVGENMTFDAEKMEEDIVKYGLYEYADFENKIPYEVFDALNIKYLKVAVGKGLITYDQIIELLKSEGVID